MFSLDTLFVKGNVIIDAMRMFLEKFLNLWWLVNEWDFCVSSFQFGIRSREFFNESLIIHLMF